MMKLDPTKIGQRRNKQTSTYHQWIYSFKNKKKYHVNRIVVTNTVMIPMVTTPHLIGKHPQQEDSSVHSFEHTQSQQQHGAKIGFGLRSSGSSFFSSSDFFSDSFYDFSDFFSDLGFSLPSLGASSAAASSPPSNRLSNSLY